MIAAAVLGLVALVALYLAFGRILFGSSSSATVKGSPTPRPSASPVNRDDRPLPTVDEQNFDYQTTPVDYRPGSAYAPDPGRNIFAFFEPPLPTPYSPTPFIPPVLKPATPTPTPPMMITLVNPQAIYAGSPSFRLEVSGERFTADAHIYFNQNEVPTTFVNEQKLATNIPANFIAQEGQWQIIVQTPNGKSYSNQITWSVQPPPRPGFQYIGMIGRKRYNNDTAYFTEAGKNTPFGARLNDIVGGRFRLVDISVAEVIFEDVSLGFRHRVPISTAATQGGQPSKNGLPNDGGFVPYNPANIPQEIPGIPNNIRRYVPPQQKPPPEKKEDADDNDDGDGY